MPVKGVSSARDKNDGSEDGGGRLRGEPADNEATLPFRVRDPGTQARRECRLFKPGDQVYYAGGTPWNAAQIAEVISPQGRLGLIEGVDSLKAFDTAPLWSKCVSIHPELMFTRSTFGTPDMIEQHRSLSETAGLVDQGVLRTTTTGAFGRLGAPDLKRAHAQLESGKTIGKVVLEV